MTHHIVRLAEAVTITPHTDIEVVRLVEAVKARGPQIVRTVEELEALDRDTLLGLWHEELDDGHIFITAAELLNEPEGWNTDIHFAVVAAGDHIRDVRKALEEA